MRVSNYIFFVIGIILFILGSVIEHNFSMFNNKELAGHIGHFLLVIGIFSFILQVAILLLKIVIKIIKEVWGQFND